MFLKYCGSQRPLLLFVDGHNSHVNLDVIDIARDNNVILFYLPPHTIHALQLLDVSVFKSFKSHFSKAVNPGRARWGRSLHISTPNLNPLMRLRWVSSQSPRGPLGGHACVHTANSNWQQYIIKLILRERKRNRRNKLRTNGERVENDTAETQQGLINGYVWKMK